MKTEQAKCPQCGSQLKSDGPEGQPYCLNGCIVDNPKDKPKRDRGGGMMPHVVRVATQTAECKNCDYAKAQTRALDGWWHVNIAAIKKIKEQDKKIKELLVLLGGANTD